MGEIQRIKDQIQKAYQGPAWYGLGLLEVLKGVTAEEGFAKPWPGFQSIAGHIHHILYWMNFTIKAINGVIIKVSPEEDWPKESDHPEMEWKNLLQTLENQHHLLIKSLSDLSETRLEETVVDKEFNYYFLLHGVIQHNIYHTGQIALIKRMVKLTEPGNQS